MKSPLSRILLTDGLQYLWTSRSRYRSRGLRISNFHRPRGGSYRRRLHYYELPVRIINCNKPKHLTNLLVVVGDGLLGSH